MKKKLFIKTYGCQMNVYDSERMQELLVPHGFETTDQVDSADLVILNTCHIREKAAEKVYSELGRIKQHKDARVQDGKDTTIVVAGCVAQAEGETIFNRTPYVDVVVGPQSYHNLPELLEQVKRNKKWAIDLDFPKNSKFDEISDERLVKGSSAFLSVQEGCDKFCHFCVVPYTRGAEYSRPVSDIYREAVKLVSKGVKEIMLLGQNVSGYRGEEINKKVGLGGLIKRIAKIEGLERIRYTTSHPADMVDEELFEVHANEPKLMPYLHLPVQSGSSKILKAMNRKHTREFYLEIIDKFRAVRPDMLFSSDFIVGYPGETEEDFEQTLDIVKRVKYGQCYSFKYSIRPGTPAGALNEQVPEDIKARRLETLQKLLSEQQLKTNQQFIGKTLPVLFEKKGKDYSQSIGKSPYLQSVVVEEPIDQLAGKIVNVHITEARQNSLYGNLLG